MPKNVPVKMVRESLDSIPEFPLPPHFSLRWFQPGDEVRWREIHLRADALNQITPELFLEQFAPQGGRWDDRQKRRMDSIELLAQRQCYLVNSEGGTIGTGTAWFNHDFEGREFGRVHWLAIVPEYQGRGLAKPLLTGICRRLRELGHDRAYLSTSSARVKAIRLYLRFGFVPHIANSEDRAAWKELCPAPGPASINLKL